MRGTPLRSPRRWTCHWRSRQLGPSGLHVSSFCMQESFPRPLVKAFNVQRRREPGCVARSSALRRLARHKGQCDCLTMKCASPRSYWLARRFWRRSRRADPRYACGSSYPPAGSSIVRISTSDFSVRCTGHLSAISMSCARCSALRSPSSATTRSNSIEHPRLRFAFGTICGVSPPVSEADLCPRQR